MNTLTTDQVITWLEEKGHAQALQLKTADSRWIGAAIKYTTDLAVSLWGDSIYRRELGPIKDYGFTITQPNGDKLTVTTGDHGYHYPGYTSGPPRHGLEPATGETVWHITKQGEKEGLQLLDKIVAWVNAFDREDWEAQKKADVLRIFDSAATAEEAWALKATIPNTKAREAVCIYTEAKMGRGLASRKLFTEAWEKGR